MSTTMIAPIFAAFVFCSASLANSPSASTLRRGSNGALQDAAYELLAQRIDANQEEFFIYKDGDSAFNHGSPSGFFGQFELIRADSFCIDSAESPDGCSQDPDALDQERGNVLQIRFLPHDTFVGVNIQEPNDFPDQGVGYDLTGATELTFDVRSPTPEDFRVQFGIDGAVAPFMELSRDWQTITVSFRSLSLGPGDLRSVHILFTVVTNRQNAPSGGIVLLDNIRVTPTPARQVTVPSLPVSLGTFGVAPAIDPAREEPFPPDQTERNLARVEHAALAILALLDRGSEGNRQRAARLADALVYALENDNRASLVPVFELADGSSVSAFHDAYLGGDLPLLNDQMGGGRQGEVRLAGYTGGASLCGPTQFCLNGDGTQLRSSALAAISLLAAHREIGKSSYLDYARRVAVWAKGQLSDPSFEGFGGYFSGFGGVVFSGQRFDSKPTDGNAVFFSLLTQLARLERKLGNEEEAERLEQAASRAAEFVLSMFDGRSGCFNAGTLPVGTPPGAGLTPDGPRRGNDVVNTFRTLESNAFAVLALAFSPEHSGRIDWRRPAQCLLDNFSQTVRTGGESFTGFSPVIEPTPVQRYPQGSPPGVSWEGTAQAVLAFQLVDRLYGESQFRNMVDFYLAEMDRARRLAPFGDGLGLVEAILEGGAGLAPAQQCLSTPFVCVPERVGLGATAWALLAQRTRNPLSLLVEIVFPFFEGDSSFFTGFAVSNYSASPAALEFAALGTDGELLDLPTNPARFDLNPGSQLALLGRDVFGAAPASSQKAWVGVASNNPEISGFFQFGDFDLGRLDGAVAALQQAKVFRVTRTPHGPTAFQGSEARAAVYVVNPNLDPISVTLRLRRAAPAPASLAQVSRDLPPLGLLAETLSELFGEVEVVDGNVEVEVSEGKGAVAFGLLRVNGRALLGLNGSPDACPAQMFSAQFATGSDVFTSLNLVNAADEPRSVTLIVFDSEGSEAARVVRFLQPEQQLEEKAAALLSRDPEADEEPFVGSLRIDADGPGVCGDVVFGDPNQANYLAALPLQGEPFLEAVFSHVANVPGFFTGLAFQNTASATADVTVEVIALDGNLVGQANRILEPGGRLSQLVPQLAPASEGQAGGYVRVRSTEPLVAQLLFGSIDSVGIRLFSAVPANRIR